MKTNKHKGSLGKDNTQKQDTVDLIQSPSDYSYGSGVQPPQAGVCGAVVRRDKGGKALLGMKLKG